MNATDIFACHGTTVVSDALDMLGIDGGLEGLARRSGSGAVVGPAFTVGFAPVESGEAAPAADYIDDAPAGAIVVLGNGGRTYCTVWGGILTETAMRGGVLGTVIHGCHRDHDDICRFDYPLWSLGSYLKSGKNRVRMVALGEPLVIGATVVRPGDLVCADGSGVVVVPADRADEVAERVGQVARIEDRVLADLRRGIALREARQRHGYHAAALRHRGS